MPVCQRVAAGAVRLQPELGAACAGAQPSWGMRAARRVLYSSARPSHVLRVAVGSSHRTAGVAWCTPWRASSLALLTGCVARRGCLEARATL